MDGVRALRLTGAVKPRAQRHLYPCPAHRPAADALIVAAAVTTYVIAYVVKPGVSWLTKPVGVAFGKDAASLLRQAIRAAEPDVALMLYTATALVAAYMVGWAVYAAWRIITWPVRAVCGGGASATGSSKAVAAGQPVASGDAAPAEGGKAAAGVAKQPAAHPQPTPAPLSALSAGGAEHEAGQDEDEPEAAPGPPAAAKGQKQAVRKRRVGERV
jgi:hypothetical protein